MRRRRNEVMVELRKTRKEEQFLKRRNVDVEADDVEENGASSPILQTLPEIICGMNSGDPALRLAATKSARKTLSRERNPPIETIIKSGIVPSCVQFLEHSDE